MYVTLHCFRPGSIRVGILTYCNFWRSDVSATIAVHRKEHYKCVIIKSHPRKECSLPDTLNSWFLVAQLHVCSLVVPLT
ncbi:uncharacterized protein LOC118388879 isoform X2 [Oncorhynchus keta]|uniref:uncharacterized protein LOC118388879 isoform X2 n=1 Tax=Oncorhynchus keta TaxID=8018 RepID=UPI00227B2B1E|nr:uncharacterized protein LOC118388879 isoform X2 [Oncorhynchus keta]